MRANNKGESPITFGDVYTDCFGQMKARETVFVVPEDHCIQNSLDYIFEIRRQGMQNFSSKETDLEA